jgi:hypothetical protein
VCDAPLSLEHSRSSVTTTGCFHSSSMAGRRRRAASTASSIAASNVSPTTPDHPHERQHLEPVELRYIARVLGIAQQHIAFAGS